MAGKGDRPRNNFSKDFRDNYDSIKWGPKPLGKLSKDDTQFKESLKKLSKRDKMFGTQATEFTCFYCNGKKVIKKTKCPVCDGRGTMPVIEWRQKIDAEYKSAIARHIQIDPKELLDEVHKCANCLEGTYVQQDGGQYWVCSTCGDLLKV